MGTVTKWIVTPDGQVLAAQFVASERHYYFLNEPQELANTLLESLGCRVRIAKAENIIHGSEKNALQYARAQWRGKITAVELTLDYFKRQLAEVEKQLETHDEPQQEGEQGAGLRVLEPPPV